METFFVQSWLLKGSRKFWLEYTFPTHQKILNLSKELITLFKFTPLSSLANCEKDSLLLEKSLKITQSLKELKRKRTNLLHINLGRLSEVYFIQLKMGANV